MGKRARRIWTKAERQAIVAESLGNEPVTDVARRHGVSPAQVFYWRRQLDVNRLETAARLLPVQVVAESERRGERGGVIAIELSASRVRIEGAVDPNCVRAVLESLR